MNIQVIIKNNVVADKVEFCFAPSLIAAIRKDAEEVIEAYKKFNKEFGTSLSHYLLGKVDIEVSRGTKQWGLLYYFDDVLFAHVTAKI